jgi:peptide deformylase
VTVTALDRNGAPLHAERRPGSWRHASSMRSIHLVGRVFVEHLSDLKQNRIRAKLKKRQRKAA